jgi:hypothetical protein
MHIVMVIEIPHRSVRHPDQGTAQSHKQLATVLRVSEMQADD